VHERFIDMIDFAVFFHFSPFFNLLSFLLTNKRVYNSCAVIANTASIMSRHQLCLQQQLAELMSKRRIRLVFRNRPTAFTRCFCNARLTHFNNDADDGATAYSGFQLRGGVNFS